MITTTSSTPLADAYYKTYAGTFYSGGTVTGADLNFTTPSKHLSTGDTYTFQIMDDVSAVQKARKETGSMFTTRIHQYIDGRFGVDVLYKDKIVQSSGRTWKRYEKAQAAGEKLVAAAVAKLFEQ